MAHLDDWPSVRDNQQFAKAAMTAQAATRLRLRQHWVNLDGSRMFATRPLHLR